MTPDPSPMQPHAKTDFGVVAILLAAFISIMEFLNTFGSGLLGQPPRQRLGNFIFHYGFLITVLSFVFAIIGLFKGGANRLVSVLAIVLLILPWSLMLFYK